MPTDAEHVINVARRRFDAYDQMRNRDQPADRESLTKMTLAAMTCADLIPALFGVIQELRDMHEATANQCDNAELLLQQVRNAEVHRAKDMVRAAHAAGFRRAVEALRDGDAYMAWASGLLRSGQRRSAGTGDVVWAADYLESLSGTTEGGQTNG